ncbi:hypothetical protein [Paraflavitalea sp. CAU 1676]|uniref:hypothetical protein n=1 Tax=Paraflavitalea sp. CAU 1676 TaxID=3032598 RepID=UPI0023DA119A|nr:hypothetical protein [Paraflavitalea sp. CAU 1676]MDF2188143.1 hypothetical protein [Paraflavitalea sp. CAU 1676]
MMRLLSFICLLLLAGYSCKTPGKTQNAAKDWYSFQSNLVDLAWNEDTLQPVQFSYFRDLTFLYTIHQADEVTGRSIRTQYEGKVEFSGDTLFLHYWKNKPANWANFLIQEMSGGYWIQYSSDHTSRFFLRRFGFGQHGMLFPR